MVVAYNVSTVAPVVYVVVAAFSEYFIITIQHIYIIHLFGTKDSPWERFFPRGVLGTCNVFGE